MDISGTQTIAAPRARVWAALNSADVLKACVPGCESMEPVSATEYKVVMVAAIGPVRARFLGKLLLSDVQELESYALSFEGGGGANGFGKGIAHVSLVDDPAGTALTYSARAQVGGKLAQIGARLIDSVAKKLAADFFGAFEKAVSQGYARGEVGTIAR